MHNRLTTMAGHRFERGARWWRMALLALATAGLLAACGPGTGGTGTGPDVLTFSGSAGMNSVPTPEPGCMARCEQLSLQLEEQRIELRTACSRFVFNGLWALSPGGELVLPGTLETGTPTGTASATATLRLQFSDNQPASRQVTAVLLGAGGALQLGPVVLLRSEAAAGSVPPGCGPA